VEVVGQGLRFVDGDLGSAVVEPDELCVLEVVGESFGVGGRYELVISGPDGEDRAGPSWRHDRIRHDELRAASASGSLC